MRLLPLVLLLSCGGDTDDSGVMTPEAPEWDPEPEPVECANAAAAPLLDAALLDADLTLDEVGYDAEEYQRAGYADYLDDAFLLPWLRDLQAEATAVPCFGASHVGSLEHYSELGHPATGALWTAMQLLDEARPEAPLDPREVGWEEGMTALLLSTSTAAPAPEPTDLPEGLADALGPVLMAMAGVVDAWGTLAAGAPHAAAELSAYGHGGVIVDYERLPDLADADVQSWVLSSEGPRVLHGPTLQLLYALEAASLEAWAGQGAEGVLLSVGTSAGEVLVLGPGDDTPGDIDALLVLDLGGDDTWTHGAGANPDGMPLGVMVDLGGSDTYAYEEDPDINDDDRLPSDVKGRYRGDDSYGPFSLSTTGRQGSGRLGVGVLMDLGAQSDHYRTLRMGQGWGHLGVGLLLDEGGDDLYEGEAGVQGGGSMGVGLLVDLGGTDTYRTYTDSQGFGYVQGVGVLLDRGEGSDTYWADPGKEEHGGDMIYASAQLPGQANSSFCQGAGFGRRGDSDGGFLSGGVGILSDGGGDDEYTAGVFAQGTGYWQGLGLLSDAGGDDTFDAYWYVQGAAAHYAIGVVLDGGGDDQVQPRFDPHNMHMGAGHDFSIGVYVDEGGDDTWRYTSLGAGASNCQGIGIFVDNGGSDSYEALSSRSTGLGNHSGECDGGLKATVESIGLFMDSGGEPDTYLFPDGSAHPQPGDDSSFGWSVGAHDRERGGAVDGDGETGHHWDGEVP